MPTEPQPIEYATLREQIEGLLTEGKVHTRTAGEWEKVETYWHIGDALQSHFHGHPRAEYGEQVVRNLSRDLSLSQSVLWDVVLFRRSLPTLPAREEYGWTHVREVLHLPTQDQRLYYLRATQEGHWSTRQLHAAIQADAYSRHTDSPGAVPPDQDPLQGQPLRGIDCPELAAGAGRNARDWADETLSQVVVRRGQYLNRELLERHLARRYLRWDHLRVTWPTG